MESPNSEKDQTRFSTPVPELDDHRARASPETRSIVIDPAAIGSTSRRGTMNTVPSSHHAALLQVNEALREAGSHSRDFEQAIIDDDEDGKSLASAMSKTHHHRRGTIRHSKVPQDKLSRSRDSSRSSSSSRPHSVDAFADMRTRERANTFCSTSPSDIELVHHRTISNGTHGRRPTFGAESIAQHTVLSDKVSVHNADEDTAFPPYQEVDTPEIDFEELEEFVLESSRGRQLNAGTPRRTQSISCQSPRRKIFQDLRQMKKGEIPNLANGVNPERLDDFIQGTTGVESDEKVNEKVEEYLDTNFGPKQQVQSEITRYSFFSSEVDTTAHAQELGDLLLPGESFSSIFDLPPNTGVWWLHLLQPRPDEIAAICKAFDIHRLTEEDIREKEEREKVELFQNYYFVSFRSFNQDPSSEDYLDPIQIYIIVFRCGVLSFSYTHTPHAANVRAKIANYRDTRGLHSDWICYALVDNIVDSFMPHIREVEKETDVIEDQVFVARAEDLSQNMRQIGQCRKKVMSLMRLLGGKADVIKGFAKRCNPDHAITPRADIGLYLGDIQDHVVTMMTNLGHYEKMLSRSHSNYLAQANMESIAAGARNNEVLNRITLIATLLVPLNLVTGLFGMNVKVPGRENNSLTWFFSIVGFLVAFVMVGVVVARRLRFF
ncbi:MAG: Mg(2+) transporter [Cirrosporium novae-zelandiae]|nr:MAG: Mg(2+) transporter [Cirrosporium novae-zelandiae]